MMKPEVQLFSIPEDGIRSEAWIDIAVLPEQAAIVYRDVENWGKIFPATIAYAQVVRTGEHWQVIEVAHKQEGRVPNTLFNLSETEIGLVEHKKKFDAWFLNRFLPAANGGTRCTIIGSVRLKGFYRLVTPLLRSYVRRQTVERMRHYVLEPLKSAAEQKYYSGDLAE